MIFLKARLTLALLIVSLTFYFFHVFNLGFNDFITLSFESSNIIWSLIFPALNASTIDLNGNFSFACLQYKQYQANLEVNPTIFEYICLS